MLLPLSAIGSMPLAAYVAHGLVIWLLVGPGGWMASNLVWALIAAGLFAFCLSWAALAGRGPLERLTARSAWWFAGPRGQPTSSGMREDQSLHASRSSPGGER